QHFRMPGDEGQIYRAFQLQLLLELLGGRQHLLRTRQIDCDAALRAWPFDPSRCDRDVATLEQLAQPLAHLDFDAREIGRKLELRVEVAVIDGADVDPQASPPARDPNLGRAEA